MGGATKPPITILMIGNSYTYTNHLDQMLQSVLKDSDQYSQVSVDSDAVGGASLASLVASGAASKLARGYGYVVLQDQSQIPGFANTDPEFVASNTAVRTLAGAAAQNHSRLVLFETWGHLGGDPINKGLFPSYEAMQTRLVSGYQTYLATANSVSTGIASVAPVGSTWAAIKLRNPQLFASFYSADASHPTPVGSYAAALVLAKAIAGALPAKPWHPAEVSQQAANQIAGYVQ